MTAAIIGAVCAVIVGAVCAWLGYRRGKQASNARADALVTSAAKAQAGDTHADITTARAIDDDLVRAQAALDIYSELLSRRASRR